MWSLWSVKSQRGHHVSARPTTEPVPIIIRSQRPDPLKTLHHPRQTTRDVDGAAPRSTNVLIPVQKSPQNVITPSQSVWRGNNNPGSETGSPEQLT